MSQWEREAIGERTREALRHKRNNGERVGNIPFGYRLAADGKHLEPHPEEQAALAALRKLRRRGDTLRGIAATLSPAVCSRLYPPPSGSIDVTKYGAKGDGAEPPGHRTRRGSEWRLESVARVIRRDAVHVG